MQHQIIFMSYNLHYSIGLNVLSNGTNFVIDSVKIRKLLTILLKFPARWLPDCIVFV